MKTLNELLLILINFAYGFSIGFIYHLISYKRKTLFKDITFSIFYIFLYIKLLNRLKKINIYLFLFILLGFIIFNANKKRFNKQVESFYSLVLIINKLFIKLVSPPIFVNLVKYIKKKAQEYKYFKQYPWLRKNKYELF